MAESGEDNDFNCERFKKRNTLVEPHPPIDVVDKKKIEVNIDSLPPVGQEAVTLEESKSVLLLLSMEVEKPR